MEAILVTNVTGDDLGFAGFIAPAGDTIIVPKPTGEKMLRQNPDKFKAADNTERHKAPRQAMTGTGEDRRPLPLPFNQEELTLSKGKGD